MIRFAPTEDRCQIRFRVQQVRSSWSSAERRRRAELGRKGVELLMKFASRGEPCRGTPFARNTFPA
jgi:hypothetical protein